MVYKNICSLIMIFVFKSYIICLFWIALNSNENINETKIKVLIENQNKIKKNLVLLSVWCLHLIFFYIIHCVSA